MTTLTLPPHMKVESLSQLRRWFMAQDTQKPESIVMTEEQYSAYKYLVWKSDPIKRFMGAPIALSTPEPLQESDGPL